jgi:L,D-transpeptidase catalytic domain
MAASYNIKSLEFNADTYLKQESQYLAHTAPDLNPKVLRLALTAYHSAAKLGQVHNPALTVIDYSLPSFKERMWVFDLKNGKLIYKTFVAHGESSGDVAPHFFSNVSDSKASSIGTYVTRETYMGINGYSLKLEGLEKGFNDNIYARKVVMHGAYYVEPEFIKKMGRAGNSFGCPAIAHTIATPIINLIKDGSIIFAYYPDNNYLNNSPLLA